jgi:tRNA (cmo5U34)-methyltransferase
MAKNMTTRYDSSLCSSIKEWSDVLHVTAYLDIADEVPHRAEGEEVLLEHIPVTAKRVLDLGTGSGRLLKMIKARRSNIMGIALTYLRPCLR